MTSVKNRAEEKDEEVNEIKQNWVGKGKCMMS